MKRLLLVVPLLLAASCAQRTLELRQGDDFISFEHAFTDRGATEARQRAEAICAKKKQVALQTTRACSLDRCTTNYHCEDRSSAKP